LDHSKEEAVMGYSIYLVDTNFELSKKYDKEILDKFRENYESKDEYGGHYESIEGLFEDFEWTIEEHNSQNKWVNLSFMGEKGKPQHLEFFETIAPYVESGLYIEMLNEFDERWRWVFQDGELKEFYPQILWGELPIKLDSLEERDVTWLVTDGGRAHIVFADLGDYYLHIEIIPDNYPGLGISWIEKGRDQEPRELIREFYQGYVLWRNGLELNLEDLELDSVG
jgi:hypothetical protein